MVGIARPILGLGAAVCPDRIQKRCEGVETGWERPGGIGRRRRVFSRLRPYRWFARTAINYRLVDLRYEALPMLLPKTIRQSNRQSHNQGSNQGSDEAYPFPTATTSNVLVVPHIGQLFSLGTRCVPYAVFGR